MNQAFDPKEGLIVVPARLWGPTGHALVRLALDTGSTSTVIRTAVVVSIGLDPGLSDERVQMTTGSGVVFAPRVTAAAMEALGQQRDSFPILCHTLPPSAGVDGLLGLDFFRGQRLTLDFRAGAIDLS